MQVPRFHPKDLSLVMGGAGHQSFGMVSDDSHVENPEMGEGDPTCYGV